MALHRIQKYSRQIVCQDCVLSCQVQHIEEIPSFHRAQIACLSLQEQRTNLGGERLTLSVRDRDLLGMLLCWHLWNSRSMPSLSREKRVEEQRLFTERRTQLTLRERALYMAIERYLLFLMPRDVQREWQVYLSNQVESFALQPGSSLGRATTRRDRISLSALYVNTALNLCQYKIRYASEQGTSRFIGRREGVDQVPLTFSSKRMSFPSSKSIYTLLHKQDPYKAKSCITHPSSLQERELSQQSKVNLYQTRSLHKGRSKLSLYCPSVLFSPEIQDIAQSGTVTLEGSFSLELV